MDNIKEKIKYFLYARKSSESEDRQIASIESQIDVSTEMAKKENLKIINILSESKSAKAPGRIIFNRMIERIHKGEAQGIICWKLDRLARNPVDGGQINWMLQQGIIKHIKTHERDYYPKDNILMMSVEFGMANQYILDLSENTKRGLKTKAQRGWFPGPAPLGYLNSSYKRRGEREIMKDPERFGLLRKMFDLILSESYNTPKILKVVNEEWGFKTRKNNPLARSTLYKVFTNSFYYGKFEYPEKSGNWYKGKHQTIITEEEYDRIQVLLGRKGKPRPKSHIFAFTGMIKCGECGAVITAEGKTKRQKNGNVHNYTYYHCTKRKNLDCSQKPIREKDLEKQIIENLSRIKIPLEFHQWAMKQLKIESKKEIGDRNRILENQKKTYKNCIKKIDTLIEMRMNNEITSEEFSEKKLDLEKEKSQLQELLNDSDKRINKWVEKAETVFNFARDAKRKFETGTMEEKKQILSALGSNLILKDGKLSILIEKPLILMEKAAKEVKRINQRLEPLKNPVNTKEIEEIYSQSPRLLPGLDSN